MKILSDLLRRKEPTAADLRAALDGLGISAKAAAIPALKAKRRTMLLDGEPAAALDRIERALTEAQREHDRAVALDEELRARLAEAESRERIDALQARKAAAEKESKAVAREYGSRFPQLIAELKALRDRHSASNGECALVDQALADIGSTDRVERTSLDLDLAARHAESLIHRL